jgi:putative copper resistance protein D
MTIGLCLISLLLPPGGPDTGAGDLAARPLLWTALVWAAAVSAQALLSMSDLYAVPAGDLTRSQMTRFLEHTNLGTAQWVTVVMVLLIALLSRYVRTRPGSTALLALSLLALAPTVLTGHAATAPSRDTAVASLLVHVVAVSLWVGGLASLAWIAVLRPAVLPAVIGRFSSLAGWCFAAVLISGTVNATIRLATANDPFGSGYGQLVLLKVLALAGLGAFGLTHRLRTVDALAEGHDPRGTRRLFFRVASAELCLMAATIGIAVALSRTPTPVGSQSHAAPALHVSTQVRS